MPSRACINFAHVEYNYTKSRARDYCLGHYACCTYTEDTKLVLAADISNDVITILNSSENRTETDTPNGELSTLPTANTMLVLLPDTL